MREFQLWKRIQWTALVVVMAPVGVGCLWMAWSPAPVRAAGQAAAAPASDDPGAPIYTKTCSPCHGDQRQGNLPAFPPLSGIHRQLTDEQIIATVRTGKGKMPPVPVANLSDADLKTLVHFLDTAPDTPPTVSTAVGGNHPQPALTGPAAAGAGLFLQNCAFCHGRDAMGGETGPDLTQSKLVLEDEDGSKIKQTVREGRIEKKMPAFSFSGEEQTSLVAFIKARVKLAQAMKGGRRGVDVSDLQTGDADAGKAYFNGAGGCSKCHSPTGDLAGLAKRYEGLRLEMRMLYPRDVKSKVTVTLPSGEKVSGTLAYQDEFTIGLRDANDVYHSWPTERVKFVVDSPVEAHVAQFPKYTDADVHNLIKYLQTLR